jgi:hypothetical protein
MSFADSVLDAADDDGVLSYCQLDRLLALHFVTITEWRRESNSRLADDVLAFLGY